jgi:hypothetical protein
MGIGLQLSKYLVVCLVSVGCGGGDGSSNTNGSGSTYWPSAYDPNGVPSAAESQYHLNTPASGQTCMACHSAGSTESTIQLVFGGTVFKADGTTPAANVQVGVVDGTKKYFVYTATNGQYWVKGTDSLPWSTTADIRIRSASGEKAKKSTDDRNADCDSCHVGVDTLKTP